MADVFFICPKCGHSYQFAAHLAGKRGRCKVCSEVFRIPTRTAPDVGFVMTPPPVSPVRAASPSSGTPATAIPGPAPAQPGREADPDRIVFDCPTCGHGYRLAAELAGKQGRCSECRGVFTIPSQSRSVARGSAAVPSQPLIWGRTPEPDTTDWPDVAGPAWAGSPPRARGPANSAPPAYTPAGDSGYWELNSSEFIPGTVAAAPAGRPGGAAKVAAAAAGPGGWGALDRNPGAVMTATPVKAARPKWVLHASIGGGVLVGALAIGVMVLTLGSGRSGPPADADAPGADSRSGSPPAPVAGAPDPGIQPDAPVLQHREAVDDLVKGYNEMAEGYSRIRDAISINSGRELIARGAERLEAASRRGRNLPALSPSGLEALVQATGPSLLKAVDRVLGELRRLKATPGLRCPFDQLIEAYTRARRAIQQELDRR